MNPTISLLDTARELNKAVEQHYLGLAVTLLEIESTKAYESEYESFRDFCEQDLKRSKGTVSKLLTVGRFIKENSFTSETVGYKRLYESILLLEGEKPEKILKAAQTWSDKDFKAAKIEKDHGANHEHTSGVERWGKCTVCASYFRV